MENELKSYHNKTDWVNNVLMQDSWMLLKSDSISYQKILQNSNNSQMQWPVVSILCPKTKKHLIRKVGWREHQNWARVESYILLLASIHGVEIWIMFSRKDNSHSWVRISHDLNMFVTNLNNNEQETSEVQFEVYALRVKYVILQADQRPKQNHKDEILPAPRQELCTRIKDNLQKHFLYFHHVWRKVEKMTRVGGNKKKSQYCTDSSGAILYLRALQGNSGRNLIDPTLHDNVIIPDEYFKYICHVWWAINLHSINNSGLPGGQISSKKQTVFFLLVDYMDKLQWSWHDQLGSIAFCTIHA